MPKIIEKILEPSRIEVGSSFLLKIKVKDMFEIKQNIIAENGNLIISENNKMVRTEWGE